MIDKALQINGWMSPQELLWLAETASKSHNILEVGSYQGRSTRAIADNTPGIIFCIDPWNNIFYNNEGGVCWTDDKAYNTFMSNLSDHIFNGKVIPFRGILADFIPSSLFDFIFIDGDHRYEFVKHDIELALKYIKPGGIIAGHDYIYPDWPGVKQAVDELVSPIDGVVGSIWHKKF